MSSLSDPTHPAMTIWGEAPAIDCDYCGHGEAVLIHGRHMVVDSATLDMLHAAGIEFAQLCDHEMPDGTHCIVTVPV